MEPQMSQNGKVSCYWLIFKQRANMKCWMLLVTATEKNSAEQVMVQRRVRPRLMSIPRSKKPYYGSPSKRSIGLPKKTDSGSHPINATGTSDVETSDHIMVKKTIKIFNKHRLHFVQVIMLVVFYINKKIHISIFVSTKTEENLDNYSHWFVCFHYEGILKFYSFSVTCKMFLFAWYFNFCYCFTQEHSCTFVKKYFIYRYLPHQ